MSSFVIICEIAERVAQPSTHAEVQKLISNDQHRRQGRFSARRIIFTLPASHQVAFVLCQFLAVSYTFE